MKLYGSLTSPYVRLCRVAAERCGLGNELDLVRTDPFADEAFRQVNPLGKVPALVARDGTVLADSGVIVRYLDGLRAGGPSLFEAEGVPRHAVDAAAALCTGVLDLGVAYLLEGRRPEAERSASWQERRMSGIGVGVLELARLAEEMPEEAGLFDLALAVTADWLAFRLPQVTRPGAVDRRAGRLLGTEPFRATDPRLG
jgi:glutathione S-transferase